MKNKLIARMKKMKLEKDMSYQELAIVLGYSSATTSHRFIKYKAIPKMRYDVLDQKLITLGY